MTEQDEMFILAFNDRVETLSGYTSDQTKLRDSIGSLRAEGKCALYDAIARGLDLLKGGKYDNRLLIVITDGRDSASKRSFGQLLVQAGKQEALICPTGLAGWLTPWQMAGRGADWQGNLRRLAEVSGATAHFPSDMTQCREAMAAITAELAGQYRLEYQSNSPVTNRNWRHVKVISRSDGSSTRSASTGRGASFSRDRKR